MTATGQDRQAPPDLDAILDTLREVEASLERRVARAQGALLMVWGFVGASIFAFYQLVLWNHDAFIAVIGHRAIDWLWVGPIALGYVLTAILGARLGRATRDADVRRGFRRSMLPALLATALAATLVVTQRYQYIFGGITLVCGLTSLAFSWGGPASRFRPWALASGGMMAIVGAALLVWPDDRAPLVAAVAFLVGLVGLGTVRYRSAE